jgi:hypothetical protein
MPGTAVFDLLVSMCTMVTREMQAVLNQRAESLCIWLGALSLGSGKRWHSDPVAVDSAIRLLENVAEVNADTKLLRQFFVIAIRAGGQLRLNFHGSKHCTACGLEDGQHGVTSRVDDSPTR